MDPKTYKFDTLSLHAGYQPDKNAGSRQVPIYQTTSYMFDDVDHAAALFNLERGGHIYSRISNPTVAVLEDGASFRVRLNVFRKDGGLYTPKTNAIDYLIEASESNYKTKETYEIDVFKDFYNYSGLLSTIKTNNRSNSYSSPKSNNSSRSHNSNSGNRSSGNNKGRSVKPR